MGFGESEVGLALQGITKWFGQFTALDDVSLSARAGSIHAVLGENGAGKTTLMNILSGLYQPDRGTIALQGQPVVVDSPATAAALGIGMIHQHLTLVDTLTAVENIVLGLKQRRLNLSRHTARIAELCRLYDFEVDLNAEVWRMPMGMRQRVEILKVLYRQANLLILDEPTSLLTPGETVSLLQVMRDLAKSGCTLLFISHKLDEVMAVADRVTMLRRGQVVAECETTEADPATLAQLMVGYEMASQAELRAAPVGQVILQARGLCADNDRQLPALQGVDLTLRQGEILGIAGVDGNGQTELAQVIAGLRPLRQGSLQVAGQDLTPVSVRHRYRQFGIAYVPGDRQQMGLVLDLSATANLLLRDYDQAPIAGRWGWLNLAAMRQRARRLIQGYDVRLQSADQPVRLLSGGNQQKLVMARELYGAAQILIAEQPCKGLDVHATAAVHRMLLAQRDNGAAILYISTELEQLLAVVDRVAVLSRGRIVGIVERAAATPEQIGLLMAGDLLVNPLEWEARV